MSKKVSVEAVNQAGIIFGKVSDPDDFQKSQDYAHEHVERVTRDALMAGAAGALIKGFGLTLTTGLSFSVATGIALSTAGKLYDTGDNPTVLTLGAAHASLPRIDLVYVLLEDSVDVNTEFRPYVRVRTEEELAAGTAPYLPQEFNQPQEVWNRATIQVRAGTPNASPTAPAANANEVALFQVRVNAAATSLNGGNVTDVRTASTIRSLAQANALVDTINSSLTALIAGFTESVQDIVGALIAQGWGVTVTYNDAGNVETIQADQAALDTRYANATGDTFIGDVNHTRTTADVILAHSTNNNFGLRIQQNHASSPNSYLNLLDDPQGSKIEFGTRDSRVDGNATPVVQMKIGPYKTFMYGDAQVVGALSKGSGTFLIDHPLDPDNKDLAHAFVEAPRDDLIYSGVITIPDGSSNADVNIDTASGMTSGTFAALTQADTIRIYTNCKGDFTRSFGEMTLGGGGGVMKVTREGSTGDEEFYWMVVAERGDPYIKVAAGHDEDGHLIVESDKPEVPTELESLLDDQTITVHSSTPASDVVNTVVITELLGYQGYPRHAAVVGEGDVPTRHETIHTVVS